MLNPRDRPRFKDIFCMHLGVKAAIVGGIWRKLTRRASPLCCSLGMRNAPYFLSSNVGYFVTYQR